MVAPACVSIYVYVYACMLAMWSPCLYTHTPRLCLHTIKGAPLYMVASCLYMSMYMYVCTCTLAMCLLTSSRLCSRCLPMSLPALYVLVYVCLYVTCFIYACIHPYKKGYKKSGELPPSVLFFRRIHIIVLNEPRRLCAL